MFLRMWYRPFFKSTKCNALFGRNADILWHFFYYRIYSVSSHTILSYNQRVYICVWYMDGKVVLWATRISSSYYHIVIFSDGSSNIVWHKRSEVENDTTLGTPLLLWHIYKIKFLHFMNVLIPIFYIYSFKLRSRELLKYMLILPWIYFHFWVKNQQRFGLSWTN